MFVPNFKILSQVVPEKSLTEKKFTDTQTNIRTEKAKTIYPLYTSYTGGIMKEKTYQMEEFLFACVHRWNLTGQYIIRSCRVGLLPLTILFMGKPPRGSLPVFSAI